MKHTCGTSQLRQLPQVEEVLHERTLTSVKGIPHTIIADAVRKEIDLRRTSILEGTTVDVHAASIAQAAAARVKALTAPSLRRVVNATGVIIHTNLGRSALAPEAIDAVKDVIVGYSSLEYDLQHMARGSRHDHCEPLICALTGAEAAIAVNNNAAAVMMVLSVFAAGHDAIVSRGEQVEIGGSFRIPDIMQQSGANMVEVGMTNRTNLDDYAEALTDDTAMVFKAHPSNFLMTGFTELVSISELRSLVDAHAAKTGKRILIYEDQGSGAFLELPRFGDKEEPTVSKSLAAGADLVSFSGDKLLGGPQAGIIVGRADLIARLKESLLARVLRLDKMTLAALEATLRIYLDPDQAMRRIPTVRMLVEDIECVYERANALHKAIKKRIGKGKAKLEVIPETSRAGGGALPMRAIDTYALRMRFLIGNAQDCWQFLAQSCPVSIVTRIHEEAVLFDARTILSDEEISVISVGVALYFDQLTKPENA